MHRHIVRSAKKLASRVVSATNLHRALHSTFYQDELTIIMYHGVLRKPLPVADPCFISEELFQQQVAYVSGHFNVVSMSTAVDMLKNGAVDKPTIVLTFDDGYQNNFDVAFPVLKKYGVPATVFLTTGLVDSSDSIWFCHLVRAITKARKQFFRWKGTDFDLSGLPQRARASVRLQAAFKHYSPPEITRLVREICQELGVDPAAPFRPESPFRILSSGAIRAMSQSGLVDFGAHTESHAILGLLSPADQEREISSSVDSVERLTGQPCKFFAYPNGRVQDYGPKAIELLKKRGITAAVSTSRGPNDSNTPLMELRRYDTNLEMPLFQLQVHHFMFHLQPEVKKKSLNKLSRA